MGKVFDLWKSSSEVSMNALDELKDRLFEEPFLVIISFWKLLQMVLIGLGHSPTHKVAIATVDINELKKTPRPREVIRFLSTNHRKPLKQWRRPMQITLQTSRFLKKNSAPNNKAGLCYERKVLSFSPAEEFFFFGR